MTLAQLLRIWWARKFLFLGLLLTVVGATVAISLLLPKKYVAEATLVADVRSVDPVSGAASAAMLSPTFLSTQMDIIRSHNVALKVVDKFKLVDIPEVREQFQQATRGIGSIRDWLADSLLNNLEVKPARDSNVFSLTFAAPDADFATVMANAFANAYIQTTIELKVDPTRRQAAWFDEQLVTLRKALEDAQQRLSEFQKSSTLVSNDYRIDVESARLAEISSQLVAAQAARSDAETRRTQMTQAIAKNRLEELPDILGNGLLQNMKAELTRASSNLSELGERYGRNHPQYKSAAASVETLKRRLNDELNTAKGSINQTAEMAKQRVTEMQASLDAQKQRILELKRSTDTRDVLNREVESAQRTYDAATQRASSIRLESQLDQSSIAVLNPATRPFAPASPRVLLNIFVSIVIGSMLGAGVALAVEMRNRRIRHASDIAEATGVVLLAQLPKPPRWTSRRRSAPGLAPLPKMQSV
jgi:succinoglycan biosynthesis transport protein ExoP